MYLQVQVLFEQIQIRIPGMGKHALANKYVQDTQKCQRKYEAGVNNRIRICSLAIFEMWEFLTLYSPLMRLFIESQLTSSMVTASEVMPRLL